MPTFKKILLILLSSILYAQINTITIGNEDSLKVENIDHIYNSLKNILIDSDELGNYFLLENIISDSTLNYNYYKQNISIDTLISRNDEIRGQVFKQIFQSIVGTKPFNESNRQFNQIIYSNSFLTDSSKILYGLYNDDQICAVIDIRSSFNNYLSGLIGASNIDNKWIINGQVDIHLENQWRTANLLDLHWKRLSEESQILNLIIEEPHPFGLPIGLNISHDQDLRDGNYVSNQSSAGIIKTIPGVAKIGFGGKTKSINSTSQGDSLGIPKLNSRSVYLSGKLDRRNDYWLPSTGYYFSINTDIGKKTVSGSDDIFLNIFTILEKYLKISDRISMLLKMQGQGTWVDDGIIHEGDLIRYGGINSLRGYTEDNFKSNWIAIPTFEFHFNISRYQKLITFTDFGIQNDYIPFPFGIGLGITQLTKNSILKIFYGIGRGDRLKNGKIHIQFYTKL